MIPRSFQDWVHWIELGPGARWIRRLALCLGVALLSGWISYKQFHGLKSEATLRQAVVGRQLADGKGYTTLINYPQTAAFLQQRGIGWRSAEFPELHSAPLYPAAIAGLLKFLPASFRNYFFDTMPSPPDGFIPDYLVLGLNVMLLWIAAAQTYFLGRALFDRFVGLLAMAALLLSATLWQHVVAANGTTLSMVVFLAVIQVSVRADQSNQSGRFPSLWLFGLGGLCGAMALIDYAGGVILLPIAASAWFRFTDRRLTAAALIVAGFLLVVAPWGTSRMQHTGTPVGLAWQDIALKTDGSTADPAVVKTTFSVAAPDLDLAKLGNKGLSSLRATLTERVWSGGGLIFAAFFFAGCLYRFRDPQVNATRALFVLAAIFLILGNAFFDAGDGERLPAAYLSPLLIIFGAGFCRVMIASSAGLTDHARWVAAFLLVIQGIPLIKDAVEPRRLHFQYPPYYPSLFLGMRDEMVKRGGANPGWMADVPAGAAWYSGQRVWAQPEQLRDFYAIGAEQPMLALVLTPKTLDRPFFSELARRTDASDQRTGEWAQVYMGLVTGRMAPGFPLSLPQKIADNLYVLIDPLAQPLRRK